VKIIKPKVRDMMSKVTGVVLGIVIGTAVTVGVVGLLSEPTSAAGTLTLEDRVMIRDLYNRYNHYIDSGKDNGYAYAGIFTEDGVFETNWGDLGTKTGREEIAELARKTGPATVTPGHLTWNVIITPSEEGAVGSAYFGVNIRPHEEGEEVTGTAWGIYTDRLVKTDDGWKFKVRKFTPAGWDQPEEWAAF
jgi:hypothetical protein